MSLVAIHIRKRPHTLRAIEGAGVSITSRHLMPQPRRTEHRVHPECLIFIIFGLDYGNSLHLSMAWGPRVEAPSQGSKGVCEEASTSMWQVS